VPFQLNNAMHYSYVALSVGGAIVGTALEASVRARDDLHG
jgi:hypothetical protein